MRYNIFFKQFGYDKSIVIDYHESSSIRLTCIDNCKVVIGYGRLTMLNNNAQISQMVVEGRYEDVELEENYKKNN